MGRHRIVAIVPALNEGATVARVVNAVRDFADVIVVDDGSTDGTHQGALSAGAVVCRHAVNEGYDSALNTGFARAIKMGYEYGVTLDADGQHDPSVINRFLAELEGGARVVVGRRPRKQRVAERLFALWTARAFGVHDPLCGMKGYDIGYVASVGHFDSYGSIGTELLLTAASTGLKVYEIEVPIRPRSDSPRFASTVRANLRILSAMWRGYSRCSRLQRNR